MEKRMRLVEMSGPGYVVEHFGKPIGYAVRGSDGTWSAEIEGHVGVGSRSFDSAKAAGEFLIANKSRYTKTRRK